MGEGAQWHPPVLLGVAVSLVDWQVSSGCQKVVPMSVWLPSGCWGCLASPPSQCIRLQPGQRQRNGFGHRPAGHSRPRTGHSPKVRRALPAAWAADWGAPNTKGGVESRQVRAGPGFDESMDPFPPPPGVPLLEKNFLWHCALRWKWGF